MMVSVHLKKKRQDYSAEVFFSSSSPPFQNDTVVIQQHQLVSTDSLVKPSMSRTLVYRTNKEFDKCAELLRNILTVQGRINKSFLFFHYKNRLFIWNKESRRNSKSSIIGETNRNTQIQSQINSRPKKQTTKSTVTKSSFIKTSMFI